MHGQTVSLYHTSFLLLDMLKSEPVPFYVNRITYPKAIACFNLSDLIFSMYIFFLLTLYGSQSA